MGPKSGTRGCTGAKLRDSPVRMEAFMRVLGETASPVRASGAAGVSPNVAYALRRDDMEFAVRWDAQVDMAMENLIGESYRRAVEGVSRPMVQGGHIVLDPETGEPVTVVEFSDRLMEVLLKWRWPEQLANRVKLEVDGPLSLDREVLLTMPDGERRVLLGALQSYAAHFRRHEAQKALTHEA
jgi:hypothetical protein